MHIDSSWSFLVCLIIHISMHQSYTISTILTSGFFVPFHVQEIKLLFRRRHCSAAFASSFCSTACCRPGVCACGAELCQGRFIFGLRVPSWCLAVAAIPPVPPLAYCVAWGHMRNRLALRVWCGERRFSKQETSGICCLLEK